MAARKLHDAGKAVRVLLLAEPTEVRGDAAEMLTRLAASPAVAQSSEELNQSSSKVVFDSELLIDAILGTGFRPPVSGPSEFPMNVARAASSRELEKPPLA